MTTETHTDRLAIADGYSCPRCGQGLAAPAPGRVAGWWRDVRIPPRRPVDRSPEEMAAQVVFDRADAVARAADDRLIKLEDETTWERDGAGQIIRGPWRFDSDPRWAGYSRDVESTTADRHIAYRALRKAREDARTKRMQQLARDAEARDRARIAVEREHRATRILEEGAVSIHDRVARLIGWS